MIDAAVGVGRRDRCLTVVVCATPILEVYHTLVQLIVGVLPEGLVRRCLRLVIVVQVRQPRLVRCVHLRVRLVD